MRSRLGAVALALWWATSFFGVIELMVGITPLEFHGFEPFVVHRPLQSEDLHHCGVARRRLWR
jgi:hypothetical protein